MCEHVDKETDSYSKCRQRQKVPQQTVSQKRTQTGRKYTDKHTDAYTDRQKLHEQTHRWGHRQAETTQTNTDTDEVMNYGLDKVTVLDNQFSKAVNIVPDCISDWTNCRPLLKTSHQDSTLEEVISAFTTNSTLNTIYPNIALLQRYAVFCLSTRPT